MNNNCGLEAMRWKGVNNVRFPHWVEMRLLRVFCEISTQLKEMISEQHVGCNIGNRFFQC